MTTASTTSLGDWLKAHVPFSHGFHVSLTALVAAAVGVFIYIHLGSSGLDAGETGAANALKSHAGVVRILSADSTRLAAKDRSIAALTAQHIIDHARFATLLATTPVQASDTALVHACTAAVRSCEARADSIASADSLVRKDLAIAKADGKMVADSLHRMAGAAQCHLIHLGFIKLFGCPDRGQAGIIGLVLGWIAKTVS